MGYTKQTSTDVKKQMSTLSKTAKIKPKKKIFNGFRNIPSAYRFLSMGF